MTSAGAFAPDPDRGAGWRDSAVLVGAAALLFGVALGARDLWNPNEPTYGQAVVEMLARRDWLLPTVNGEVFAEKPILYYWLALLASAVVGPVNELTLRLPSAVAGAATVLLTHRLTLAHAGRVRAALAGGLVGTTYLVLWSARSVQMDMLLTAAVLATVLCAVRVIDRAVRPWPGWGLAGLCAALGVLAKGPVALVCATPPIVAYALARRRTALLREPALLAAAAAFAAALLPWLWALAARGELGILDEMLVRQSFGRFQDAWDHERPWWYFLAWFWIDMAPWSFLVPFACSLPRRGERTAALDRSCWAWLATVLLFFSFSGSKRSAYLLPVAPAVAILASAVLERWWSGGIGPRRELGLRVLAGVQGLVLVGAAVALGLRLPADLGASASRARIGLALLAATGVGFLLAALVPGRVRTWLPALVLTPLLALYLWTVTALLPDLDRYKSARAFSAAVVRRVGPTAPLCSYGMWRWRASYAFYTGRIIPRLASPVELAAYWSRAERACLLVEAERLDEARAVVGQPLRPLESARIGSSEILLLCNR